MSITQTFTVTGMTCGHCVASVTEEVSEISGVHDVVVDLEKSSLTFSADVEIPRVVVVAAVTEAGFSVAE
jgi:copper chaperone